MPLLAPWNVRLEQVGVQWGLVVHYSEGVVEDVEAVQREGGVQEVKADLGRGCHILNYDLHQRFGIRSLQHDMDLRNGHSDLELGPVCAEKLVVLWWQLHFLNFPSLLEH